MGAFSRLRYVIAANVNSLIEKAEDPEKLLRALIREMEDASEEARMATTPRAPGNPACRGSRPMAGPG